MNIPNGFRITTILLSLAFSWFALSTIFAEIFTPKRRIVSLDVQLPVQTGNSFLKEIAAAAAPLRGDLIANMALARATTVLNATSPSTSTIERDMIISEAEQALTISPYNSDIWLLLAILQNQGAIRDRVADLLKMSYLTSSADVDLIPARLSLVTAASATSDNEVKDLARNDIRIIMTRRPDLKPAIVNAYRRGSAEGKSFIDDTVKLIDPIFAASLH